MRRLFRKRLKVRRKASKETKLTEEQPVESQAEGGMPPEEQAETYQGLVSRLTEALLRNYASDGDRKKNLVFSPYSILTLLNMAADAAGGTTREEILNAVAGGLDLDRVRRMQAALTEAIAGSGDLLLSNAVCVLEDLKDTIRSDYPGTLRKYFSGELFSSADIVGDVNAWVRDKTKDMIDGILDDSMQDILLCLANAIAFQADWKKQYEEDDIYDELFVNADGTSSELPMLHSTESGYVEDEAFTGFVKPYKDDRFSFMALLPKQDSYEALLQAPADFSKLYMAQQSCDVHVYMPEFNCDFKDNLTDFCRSLGIQEVFSGAADFSPLSSARLNADMVLHKAHIEVDRRGTKAAAVSAMVMTRGCLAPEDFREHKTVELNRPFVYAIIHNETAIPVFVGITKHIDAPAAGDGMTSDGFEVFELAADAPDTDPEPMIDDVSFI